jgi:hypothetical protein
MIMITFTLTLTILETTIYSHGVYPAIYQSFIDEFIVNYDRMIITRSLLYFRAELGFPGPRSDRLAESGLV